MEGQVLIVILDENLRMSDAAYLIEKLRNQDGIKAVQTFERVVQDALDDSKK